MKISELFWEASLEELKRRLYSRKGLFSGVSLYHVVKSIVHLSDLNYFADFNKVLSAIFSEPYPVRTMVGSQLAGFLVEIDVRTILMMVLHTID